MEKEENKKKKSKEIKENKTKERKTKKSKKTDDMEIVDKTVLFTLTEVIIIILITGVIVSFASGLIVYNNYDRLNYRENYKSSYGEISEFVENYNKILNNSVEEVDKKELLDSAIKGMYNYLNDDYSAYLSVEDTNSFEEQLTGEYTGIGIEIRTDINDDGTYKTVINRVFKDTPAEEAGLLAGDEMIKIDGVDVVDANSVANAIKNGDKESYDVTYKRNGEEKTLTITRKRVYIDSVNTQTYENVGYIKIDTFSATTYDQMKKALDSFGSNINSLVIDVRDNTGGYLDAAYKVSDLFIEKDKPIYQLKNRNNEIKIFKANDDIYKKFDKIAVLINGSSASASEIMALALKESANATIVGTKSYGKGTVQETDVLSSGAMVKFTTSYWLSPNGNSINKEGIKPDIEVSEVEKQVDEAVKAVK